MHFKIACRCSARGRKLLCGWEKEHAAVRICLWQMSLLQPRCTNKIFRGFHLHIVCRAGLLNCTHKLRCTYILQLLYICISRAALTSHSLRVEESRQQFFLYIYIFIFSLVRSATAARIMTRRRLHPCDSFSNIHFQWMKQPGFDTKISTGCCWLHCTHTHTRELNWLKKIPARMRTEKKPIDLWERCCAVWLMN